MNARRKTRTTRTSGTTARAARSVPPISVESLQELRRGAKVIAPGGGGLPFDALDPDAPNDQSRNLRTNPYLRALIAYVNGIAPERESEQETITSLIREAAMARLRRR